MCHEITSAAEGAEQRRFPCHAADCQRRFGSGVRDPAPAMGWMLYHVPSNAHELGQPGKTCLHYAQGSSPVRRQAARNTRFRRLGRAHWPGGVYPVVSQSPRAGSTPAPAGSSVCLDVVVQCGPWGRRPSIFCAPRFWPWFRSIHAPRTMRCGKHDQLSRGGRGARAGPPWCTQKLPSVTGRRRDLASRCSAKLPVRAAAGYHFDGHGLQWAAGVGNVFATCVVHAAGGGGLRPPSGRPAARLLCRR